jgi:hypothetical protein
MGFLKRLFGGEPATDRQADTSRDADGVAAKRSTDAAADEAERERELLRADAERMNDELIQRQLRYADRSWTPPAQGGTKRADDEGAPES